MSLPHDELHSPWTEEQCGDIYDYPNDDAGPAGYEKAHDGRTHCNCDNDSEQHRMKAKDFASVASSHRGKAMRRCRDIDFRFHESIIGAPAEERIIFATPEADKGSCFGRI